MKNEDIEKAAKLTPEEIDIINNAADKLSELTLRPLVLMGLASHLIGIVVRGSDGTLSKELVGDLVLAGVEE